MGRAWGRQKRYKQGFCWEDLRERCHLEDKGTDGKITLKSIFKNWDGGGAWTELILFRMRTVGGLL
jgi:hypothetical protein